MSKFIYIILAVILLSGCSRKSPHGRYIARVDAGTVFVQMAYDFRENHAATFGITTDGAVLATHGQWRTDSGSVLFDGTATNLVTKKTEKVFHVLHFDGDDLFRDDLSVRFVHER